MALCRHNQNVSSRSGSNSTMVVVSGRLGCKMSPGGKPHPRGRTQLLEHQGLKTCPQVGISSAVAVSPRSRAGGFHGSAVLLSSRCCNKHSWVTPTACYKRLAHYCVWLRWLLCLLIDRCELVNVAGTGQQEEHWCMHGVLVMLPLPSGQPLDMHSN